MRSDQDGIYIQRRVIFIMVFVSLCINVFFLLMGILIGKDDKKWKEQTVSDTGFAQVVEEDNLTRDALESELSIFENETDEERDKPIDVSYLDSGFEEPKKDKPKPQVRSQAPTPQPKPAETASKQPRQTAPPASSRFWVQIVATGDRAKADDIRSKAASSGFRAVVVTQGAYHKVHLGPYGDRAEAGKNISKIKKDLGYDGWIVTK